VGFRRPQNDPNYPDYPPLPGGGPDDAEVILRQVAPSRFQLLHGFTYDREGTNEHYPLPPHDPYADPTVSGNWTDLASVPPILTWFIGTYGLHTRAALLHDHYVDVEPGDREKRKLADTVFRDALRESGVPWLRRWLMWTAVSLYTSVGKVGLFVLLAHLVLLAATTAWWVFGSLAWWIPLVLGLVGFAWGLRRWPLAVFGFALVGVPALLVGVVRLVTAFIEYVVETVVFLTAKVKREDRSFERPRVNPAAKRTY